MLRCVSTVWTPMFVLAVCLIVVQSAPADAPAPESADRVLVSPVAGEEGSLVWVEPGPRVTATLRADGSAVEYDTFDVWKPICGSDLSQFTLEDLKRIARETREAIERNAGGMIVLNQGGRSTGPDLIFNVIPPGGDWVEPPPGAVDALAVVEAYVESQFEDPMTMPIDIGFRALGAGILGSTSSNFVNGVTWSTARDALVADMDANDLVQIFLPSPTVPVYFDASTSTVSNLSVVNFTRANYNAAVGSVGGSAATISISTDFTFDYDPTDGITIGQTCFQSVMVHEVGHMIGFVSRADAPSTTTMHILDVFRFQFTDGVDDRNPDSLFEFFGDPRTVDFDNPEDDAISDVVWNEYRMADGDPLQASHFRDETPQVCLMDPTIRRNVSFAPNFYFDCDLVMFDAIGWNRNGTLEPPLPAPYPHDRPKNRYVSFAPNPANVGIDVAHLVYVLDYQAASCDGTGGRCRLDHGNDDCNVCSLSGNPCITAPVDCAPGQSCLPTGDTCVNDLFNTNVGFEGRTWWVAAPNADGIARLVSQSNRYVSDNWPTIVHIGDCEIAPLATYAIQAYDLADLSAGGLNVATISRPTPNYWADCVGALAFFCDGDSRNPTCDPLNNTCPGGQSCMAAYPPPDGVTNFDDIGAAVASFASLPGTVLPDKTWVDIHGDNFGSAMVDPPNFVINFSDIDFMVKAFQGRPYAFVDPALCPDVP